MARFCRQHAATMASATIPCSTFASSTRALPNSTPPKRTGARIVARRSPASSSVCSGFADAGRRGPSGHPAASAALGISRWKRRRVSHPPPLALYVHVPVVRAEVSVLRLQLARLAGRQQHWPAADGDPRERLPRGPDRRPRIGLPLVWGRRVDSVFIGGGTPSLLSGEGVDELLPPCAAACPCCRTPKSPSKPIREPSKPESLPPFALPASTACRWASRASTRGTSGPRPHPRRSRRQTGDRDRRQPLRQFQSRPDVRSARADAGGGSADVDAALACAPPHLSCYQLTIEANTAFAARPRALPDPIPVPTCRTRSRRSWRRPAIGTTKPRLLRGLAGVPAQPQLLAVRRLPGHRCRRPRQADAARPRAAPDALEAAGAVSGQGGGRHAGAGGVHRRPAELPFEFMLNALRLVEGFDAPLFECAPRCR
jgi:hypothetical protein